MRQQHRAGQADGRAQHPAGQAQQRGLDQELAPDHPGSRAESLRRPISRIRSVTETSMMFMTPMPPTSSEIAAIPASSAVSVLLTEPAVESSDCWLLMVKSGFFALTPCRLSSSAFASW